MAVRRPPVPDVPLIVEDLLFQVQELHRAGAPPAEVDERLAEANAWLADDLVEPQLPLEWSYGQA